MTEDSEALIVHRCRMVRYTPAGIVSLDFAPESAGKNRRLACARANGDIEIWNPRADAWHLERIIPGTPKSPIEAVLWTHQIVAESDSTEATDADPETAEERASHERSLRCQPPRLFSAGLDGRIVEWDLITLRPRQIIDSNGGAVWCMAVNRLHTRIAVGCEDGFVRVYDISEGNLTYQRSFERQDGRLLSLVWHQVGQNDFVIAGGADSCIRKFDARTGRNLQRMMVDTRKGEETVVWAVTVIKDGTIIAGDSLGNVSFWDWKTGTAKKTMRVHHADVLCLAANKEGTKVWTSGVDQRVVQITRLTKLGRGPKKTEKKDRKWILSGDRRYHSHDVRAMVLMEDRPYDALVTGGVDTTLVYTSSIAAFPQSKQYRLPMYPHRPLISLSRASRLLMCRFSDHVKVWQLGSILPLQGGLGIKENYQPLEHQKEKLLLNIKPKAVTNLCASAISENGQWIAVSDMGCVKLFSVTREPNEELKVRKCEFPSPAIVPAAYSLCFTPDSLRLIVAGIDSTVYIVDLSRGDERVFEVVQRFKQHCGQEDEGGDVEMGEAGVSKSRKTKAGPELICSLAVSSDGQWLASGDLANRIHVYNLDSLRPLGSRNALLTREQRAISLKARRQRRVAAAIAGRRKAESHEEGTPEEQEQRQAEFEARAKAAAVDIVSAVGTTEENGAEEVIVISDESSSDEEMDDAADGVVAEGSNGVSEEPVDREIHAGIKRSRSPPREDGNWKGAWGRTNEVSEAFRMEHRYFPLMFADYAGPNELVVVERPILNVLEELPSGFYRHKYGT
ncbi:U3 small nucleolar RNA-associated protein 4 [Borealophlyctis nickersoniae]|nr:U3 small nucleolar RNA-associated protein 4 [Borealophlyctis nickersoniae]